jgi:flagellar protein FliO/FliZ
MDSLILGLRVLLSLGAVFGLMWLAYRRVRSGSPSLKARSMSVVARQTVGPKASVVLVDTEGKRFLLGVTEHGINVLHSGEAPEAVPVLLPDAAEPAPLPLPVGPDGEPLTRRAIRQASFEAELAQRRGSVGGRGPATGGSILDPGTWRLAAGTLRHGWRP